MEEINKWLLCDGCNIVCPLVSQEKIHFFFLFKNPFEIPDRFKCKRIQKREEFNKNKIELKRRSQEVMNGCKACKLDCCNPRLKNGKGGNDCPANSKEDKLFIDMAIEKWKVLKSPLAK